MEKQINQPFITYESVKVQYEIKASSKFSDENAKKNIIGTVQSILDARDEKHALNVKVTWTLY